MAVSSSVQTAAEARLSYGPNLQRGGASHCQGFQVSGTSNALFCAGANATSLLRVLVKRPGYLRTNLPIPPPPYLCLFVDKHTHSPFFFHWPVTHRMFVFSHNHWWTHMTPPPHSLGVITRPCSVTATNWQQAHPKKPHSPAMSAFCEHGRRILKTTAQQPLKSMDFFPPGLSETETPQRLNGVHKTRHSSLAQLEVAVFHTGSHGLWWLSCLATVSPISRSSQAPIYTTPFSLSICLLRDG